MLPGEKKQSIKEKEMCSYKEVKEWSKKAGLTVNDKFTLNVNEVDKDLSVELIHEELDELRYALDTKNKEEVIDALNDLQWVIDRAKQTYGVKPKSFQELVRSNNTKFCKSISEAVRTQNAYANGTHPNKLGKKIVVTIEKFGEVFTIKNENGKLMKSINFVDCDYSKFI